MPRSALSFVLMAGAVLGGMTLPRAAFGGFEIVSESVCIDKINDQVLFTLVFNEQPDFLTTDENGAQTQAFQYEIDGDWTFGQDSFGFDRIDAVFRGVEIHEEGDLRVRDTRSPGDPDSGGWGRIVASVPLSIDGNEVTFSVNEGLIDDHDGKFQYRVFSMENGSVTSMIHRTVIPLPTAVWSGLGLFGGLCAMRVVRFMRARATLVK